MRGIVAQSTRPSRTQAAARRWRWRTCSVAGEARAPAASGPESAYRSRARRSTPGRPAAARLVQLAAAQPQRLGRGGDHEPLVVVEAAAAPVAPAVPRVPQKLPDAPQAAHHSDSAAAQPTTTTTTTGHEHEFARLERCAHTSELARRLLRRALSDAAIVARSFSALRVGVRALARAARVPLADAAMRSAAESFAAHGDACVGALAAVP